MRPLLLTIVLTMCGVLTSLSAAEPKASGSATAPFPYVRAKAFHIPSETTTEESGYFSLCEGRNGKIYVGAAAYGRNAYLVEFDPATEKMRIVLDTHKLVGLPLTPTGYAAQAKIRTRNFVDPSGKTYVGFKLVYPTAAENLGIPMPLDEARIAAGK